MEFDRVDPDDGDQVAAVVALRTAAAALEDPTSWPVRPEILVGDLRYGSDLRPEECYLVRSDPGADPVALMTIEMPTRDNLQLLWTEIVVHPDHRRRGYGTQVVG
jgi:GNAT superfamily N-acetyltransferase